MHREQHHNTLRTEPARRRKQRLSRRSIDPLEIVDSTEQRAIYGRVGEEVQRRRARMWNSRSPGVDFGTPRPAGLHPLPAALRSALGAAAQSAVTIGDEDPDFAGGSYAVVQKYLHDLEAWDALPIEEQERAIGRTKLSDIELPDDVKPGNSHVALNVIVDEDGEERQIMRFNMPFGRVGMREFGTFFIAYARTPDVIEEMLSNMFIGKPAGNYDRILDFSTALTGNLFFVPSGDFLDDPPTSAAEEAPTASQDSGTPTADDGSLRIGSLKDRGIDAARRTLGSGH